MTDQKIPKKTDVPEELEKHQANKKVAEERAEDLLKQDVSRSECFLSSIGYIGFLCVLPIVLLPESKFAQYHGKQALVLAILFYFLDVLQIFPSTVEALYTVLKYGVILYAVYFSFNAKLFHIPFVADLAGRFELHIQKKPVE